jgi:hypothetical protein
MRAFHRLAFLGNLRFNQRVFDRFSAPRRPRHRWLRVVLGIAGVGVLLALLFVSVFVGIAMLAAGMLWRLWKQRGTPIAARAGSIEGDFRVVGKAQLPLAR